jgi:hypothetical protein
MPNINLLLEPFNTVNVEHLSLLIDEFQRLNEVLKNEWWETLPIGEFLGSVLGFVSGFFLLIVSQCWEKKKI